MRCLMSGESQSRPTTDCRPPPPIRRSDSATRRRAARARGGDLLGRDAIVTDTTHDGDDAEHGPGQPHRQRDPLTPKLPSCELPRDREHSPRVGVGDGERKYATTMPFGAIMYVSVGRGTEPERGLTVRIGRELQPSWCFGDVGARGLRGVVAHDADHLEVGIPRVIGVEGRQRGVLLLARDAPRVPEVDEDDLALQVPERSRVWPVSAGGRTSHGLCRAPCRRERGFTFT